ncbi:putative insecticidal toxin complex protein [Yersinia thracica]|uniref:Putative insecticidal toxin complex protein n=1 Tax=Yersinia thracica TaxID=2890319 RepID=A0A0T9R173_9GAMM|nr:Tc toxin subunit A [Yersinia thracica]CNI39253.1 putative insecticidal toxin complex protein [Yersinia thracica]
MPNKKSNLSSTATTLEKEIAALNIPGLKTIFDVAGESPAQFIEQVVKANSTEEIANLLYCQAKAEVNNQYARKRAQQLRLDPVLQSITKLNTLDEVTPLRTSANQLTDNAIPERTDKYAAPSSIQSMFSPSRYLCKLYEVAQELHDKNSPLHIDKRRPDLQTLILSDETAKQEVSTLDILLETLQKKINLDDLAKITGKYDEDSFTLPYDDELTIINAVLESKHTRLRNIAALLADDIQQVKLTPALVQEQLGLNPASYDLLTAESSLTNNKRLAHAAKLTVSQLNKLIADIQGNSHSTNEQVLTVLSEYVRLNHQYGLSVDQFSAVISKRNDSATGEIIPQLFGLSFSQAEMLLMLCEKPEVMKNIAQGDISTILSAISELENIVQWVHEKKLDLTALNAMLTTQYSATATPELFNFLSNIYHSVDIQADAELLKQSLCRSLAAGFHLKTEVIAGLVRWLESNDADFKPKVLIQNITDVFADNPTLEKLEHHPELVAQCQKLSQYVLIAQWAELTPQDIDLLLQPQLMTGSEQPLRPNFSLLCLLADFKAWQQQVKVPVSEALRYFPLLNSSDGINLKNLKLETKELEKQVEDINKKLTSVDENSNKIKELKTSSNNLSIEIQSIESKITSKNALAKRLTILIEQTSSDDFFPPDAGKYFAQQYEKQKGELLNYIETLTSNLKGISSDRNSQLIEIEQLSHFLQLTNEDIISESKKREELNLKIKNNNRVINEITFSEESMLVKIHGWDQQQAKEMIENTSPEQYPVQFITVNKLCSHINMAHQLNITVKDLMNLKSLALEAHNDQLKSVVKSTTEGLIASL